MLVYLRHRKQFVVINGFSSSTGSLCTRVSQRSVLGLRLFQLFINDLLDYVNCNILIFADITIYSPDAQTIKQNLQHILLLV